MGIRERERQTVNSVATVSQCEKVKENKKTFGRQNEGGGPGKRSVKAHSVQESQDLAINAVRRDNKAANPNTGGRRKSSKEHSRIGAKKVKQLAMNCSN